MTSCRMVGRGSRVCKCMTNIGNNDVHIVHIIIANIGHEKVLMTRLKTRGGGGGVASVASPSPPVCTSYGRMDGYSV